MYQQGSSHFIARRATLMMVAALLGCGGRTALDPSQATPGPISFDAAPRVDLLPDRSGGDLRDLGAARRDLRDATLPSDDARAPTAHDGSADLVPSDCGGGRLDPISGLCWQQPRSSRTFDQDSWQEAVVYCETLSLGESVGWRLPTFGELLGLLDGCDLDHNCNPCAESSRCSALFGTDGAVYWSSTSNNPSTGDAWTVNFGDGTSYYNYGRPERHRVRCVRPGP